MGNSVPNLTNPYDAPSEYIHLEEAKAYLHGYNDGAKAGVRWKEQQHEEERKEATNLLERSLIRLRDVELKSTQEGNIVSSLLLDIHSHLIKYSKP